MIRILVYDNDPNCRYGIYEYLKSDYEVFITKKQKDVFQILNQTNINLIICDYSTIEIDIKNFIDTIKDINNKTLIMIISLKICDEDKKILLKTDIDEYMEKPLDLVELGFRIENLLKKQMSQYKKCIEINNLKLDCDTQTITYNDNNMDFFNKEFQILYHLLSYPNKVFMKRELVDIVCDNDESINENTIRAYINLIRKKIKDIKEIEIITIKGIGYKGVIKK